MQGRIRVSVRLSFIALPSLLISSGGGASFPLGAMAATGGAGAHGTIGSWAPERRRLPHGDLCRWYRDKPCNHPRGSGAPPAPDLERARAGGLGDPGGDPVRPLTLLQSRPGREGQHRVDTNKLRNICAALPLFNVFNGLCASVPF